MKIENLFEILPGSSDREQIRCLLESSEVRIEQIVSHAQPSPKGFWYDQPNDEWVILLQGTATLLLAPEARIELKAGDSLLVPAHLRHRVERTSKDAIWLAVHLSSGTRS